MLIIYWIHYEYFTKLCGDVLKSHLVSYCVASLVSVRALAWPFIVTNRKFCSVELE